MPESRLSHYSKALNTSMRKQKAQSSQLDGGRRLESKYRIAGQRWGRCTCLQGVSETMAKQFRKAPASLSEAVTAQGKKERVVAESWCPNIAARRRHAEQMGLVCPDKL